MICLVTDRLQIILGLADMAAEALLVCPMASGFGFATPVKMKSVSVSKQFWSVDTLWIRRRLPGCSMLNRGAKEICAGDDAWGLVACRRPGGGF